MFRPTQPDRNEVIWSVSSLQPTSDRDGFENVEAVQRGADDRAGYLGVPVHLLDILLPLMHEEQLRGDVLAAFWRLLHRPCLFVVLLYGKVPERNLIIRPRSGEYRVFRRMPFNGSDRRPVPVEGGHGRWVWCGGPDGRAI